MRGKSIFRAITLLFALMASQAAMAGDELCLVVTETGGAEVQFALSIDPVISFDDGWMVVETGDEAISWSSAIEGVADFHFAQGETTMVGRTIATGNGGTVFSAGKAYVSGLDAGASVCVYAIDGQLVSTTPASPGGEAVVDFSGLRAGTVYILRTPAASYKIVNK